MKTTIVINAEYPSRGVPEKYFSQLLSLYPEGCKSKTLEFASYLAIEDERNGAILNILKEAGLKPWNQQADRAPTEFLLVYRRDYDERDFEQSCFLNPTGNWNSDFEEHCRRDDGKKLVISPQYFGQKSFLDLGDMDALVVSDDVKRLLESSGFVGMSFRTVRMSKDEVVIDAERLWELTSNLRMPPLSPYCSFLDDKGNPASGSAEIGYLLCEGFYSPQELHYEASKMQAMLKMDFALTRELISYGGRRWKRHLITSQRFYQFCRKQGLAMNWVPVRIDPE